MAIKSSGSLRLRYDIAADIYTTSGQVSLNAMGNLIGDEDDTRMSEFYGYQNYYNYRYFQTRRGAIVNAAGQTYASNHSRIAFSGWFRVGSTSKKTQVLFSSGRADVTTQYMLRAFYSGNLNRMVIQIYDTGGTRRMRREYPLHNSPNVEITGVTSSGTGWERDQLGNTDSNGYVHLSFIWDMSTTSYTGLKCLWNGQELTYSVNNQSTSTTYTNQSGWKARLWKFYVGHSINNSSYGATNNFEGGIDNIWMYGGEASMADVQTTMVELYNRGNEYNYNINGLYPYAGQGFEGNLTNQAYMTSGKGYWAYVGTTYSISVYT